MTEMTVLSDLINLIRLTKGMLVRTAVRTLVRVPVKKLVKPVLFTNPFFCLDRSSKQWRGNQRSAATVRAVR